MQNLSIARRYARALIDVASETGAFDRVADQLDALANGMNTHPDLRDVLLNPAYTRTQRGAVIDALMAAQAKAGGKLDPTVVSVLNLLLDRNRFGYLPDIARLYREFADARAGRVRGKVTTAAPLAKDLVTKMEQALEKSLQRNVILETAVDPALLGGVSAQVGSMLFDGSLRSQLEELRRSLKSQ